MRAKKSGCAGRSLHSKVRTANMLTGIETRQIESACVFYLRLGHSRVWVTIETSITLEG